MKPLWCTAIPGGLRLAVQIAPGAKKNEVVGVMDEALKLKLQAQPVEGQANEALLKFLARALGVPRAAISITHGLTSRRKLIKVMSAHLTPDDLQRQLLPWQPGAVRADGKVAMRSCRSPHQAL